MLKYGIVFCAEVEPLTGFCCGQCIPLATEIEPLTGF